ncbi:MAG: hypothetical protein WCO78_01015 [Candidatus Roizmanbacteria bacterium]
MNNFLNFHKTYTIENLYIRILSYGDKHPCGFTYEELKKELSLIENSWEDKTIKCYIDNALKSGRSDWSPKPGGGSENWVNPNMDSIFFVIERNGNENTPDNHKFILKYDAYFNYINYEDLKNTQHISYLALFLSFLSFVGLIISIIASLIQISISYEQLKSPVEIKQEQIQSIEKNMYSVKCIKDKL